MKNRNQKIRTLLTLLVLSPFLWLMGQTSAQYAPVERYLQETEIVVDETLSSGGLCPGSILIPLANDLKGPNADDLKGFFDGTVERFRAWEAFFPDQAIRTNTTWLQKLDNYLTAKPNKLDEVTDQFAIEKGKNRVTAYLRGLLERTHFDGDVFRGDKASVTPTQAFNNGIPAQGSHDNLIKHLDGGNVNKGDFVSTSKDINIADGFAGNNGYVFKVKSRNGKGVDVNETLGDEVDNWFPEQLEVSMTGGIDKADIIGAYPKGSYTSADFIPNPNYIP